MMFQPIILPPHHFTSFSDAESCQLFSRSDRMPPDLAALTSRRRVLAGAGMGLSSVALSHLMAESRSHFPAKAKRVIWLFMHGGPSHVELFDPKPELIKHAGKPLPESYGAVETRRKVAQNPLLGPVKAFRKHGQSGIEISEFLPRMAEIADEMCVVRSCHGDSVNHPQSVYQMNTGSILMGKPSLGSWVSYGLGSENADMPAFVVMPDPDKRGHARLCRDA